MPDSLKELDILHLAGHVPCHLLLITLNRLVAFNESALFYGLVINRFLTRS